MSGYHQKQLALLRRDLVADAVATATEYQDDNIPKATLKRRAKSYSDFYQAVRAQLKDAKEDEVESCIKTELDFLNWYSVLADDLLDLSDSKYQGHLDQLDLQVDHLDSILDGTASTLNLLSTLSSSFRAVEAQTTAFRNQCEGSLSEQLRLTTLTNGIKENLRYYDYLEPLARRLNAPSAGTLVRGDDFSDMLTHLDECLKYMKNHMNQKEAELYRSRYSILLTRALTLIRSNFVGALRDISSEVSKRIADRQLNDTTMSALLYAKFRTGASDMKRLGTELQKRAVVLEDAEAGSESEYQSLMNELYTTYSSTRAKLVLPVLRKRMAEIALAPSNATDLVAFARSSISYVQGICLDEFDLWNEWFEGQAKLYEFLESVCEPLYDYLRPRIIHETQLPKLCELCTLLQARYMGDPEEDADPGSDQELDFSLLIHSILEDAQTRLVFRAQAILRDEIESYKPKPEDLDYPGHIQAVALSGTRTNSRKTKAKEVSAVEVGSTTETDGELAANGKDFVWGFGTEATLKGWYPTLKKAIWLLSRIYRLVNSTVFDDLAHQIVHQTTNSLHTAAALISTKSTTTDSQLFLIKHLLILKQQIVAFDIEYVTPDVSIDFSVLTNTFWELRERGGLFNPRALVRLVGRGLLPRVVENMLDAKVELDGRLRTVINDYCRDEATKMTVSIAGSDATFGKKDFDAAGSVRTVRETVQKHVPVMRKKLEDYLEDLRTRETLIAAVQDQVVQNYEDFCEAVERVDGQTAKAHGKGRMNGVWDVGTFSDWLEDVFEVRLGISEDAGDSDVGSFDM